MNEQLSRYLDGLFAPYEDTSPVKDLKEELLQNLQEKYQDLKSQGYDDEMAYHTTIGSIGDVSEIMESIAAKTKELLQLPRKNFSSANLRNSDLAGVAVHDGKFNSTDLNGSDFSGSDLTDSTFKWCDLRNVRFDGANLSGARFIGSDLRKASFTGSNLENTSFKDSELSGVSFDNLTLVGTIFDRARIKGTTFRNAVLRNVSFQTEAKQAIFDGTRVDKLTYAVLRSYGANLAGVTVIQ